VRLERASDDGEEIVVGDTVVLFRLRCGMETVHRLVNGAMIDPEHHVVLDEVRLVVLFEVRGFVKGTGTSVCVVNKPSSDIRQLFFVLELGGEDDLEVFVGMDALLHAKSTRGVERDAEGSEIGFAIEYGHDE